jgi:hypothetical protein
VNLLPQPQETCVTKYSGWMPSFMVALDSIALSVALKFTVQRAD